MISEMPKYKKCETSSVNKGEAKTEDLKVNSPIPEKCAALWAVLCFVKLNESWKKVSI